MPAVGPIIWREWKRIFKLPAHYLVLVVLPPLLFFLYALIYQNQQADHLPVAVWDEDQSMVSRQLLFLLSQSETIHFTRKVDNLQDLEKLIQSGTVMGAVHIPRNLQTDVYSKHPTNVILYTNASFIVPAKLIYKEAAQVIITAASGIIGEKFVKTGMDKNKAMALVQPIRLTSYILYNPSYSYQKYLVPGLITVGLQMMIIMVGVLLLNYEAKTGTMGELKKIAKGSASAVVVCKALAHLSVCWVNLILVALVIFPIFDIGIPGATGKLFVLFSLLALACIGIGLMVSAIIPDPMMATDIALFYTSPAFVFSGFTFPRWAMPWYDQYYANVMPYTPFLDGFFKVYYMNLPLRYAGEEMGKLCLFIVFTWSVAILVFQQRFKRYG